MELAKEAVLEDLLDWMASRPHALYPAQEEAILELAEGKNVILNTPTGSGKSLVASGLHRLAMAMGRRSVYTCPIKALVNEKWLALCKEFGPENVGLSTGDATVNHGAPILCCTAEILSNIALRDGSDCAFSDIIVDEFHYYSDRERGVAWQVPLLTLSRSRFLLMSATLGDTEFFARELSARNGMPTATIRSSQRPVPLEFTWSQNPLANTVQELVNQDKAPVYVVHFTQAEAAGNAQNFTSLELCTKEEKAALSKALDDFRFTSPYGPDIKRWLRMGIGLHHAGLLPKYRILVERLAQQGLLKVICGTDTLGVGVNVPIRTVLFTQLCKYSGDKTALLTARDFHQIAGRAGRKGFDSIGYVVAQAPEHVIENLRLAAKAGQSGRKYAKKQPPEKGFVPWDNSTFERLQQAAPEPLVSRFTVSHGMLLNVLSRSGDGCRDLRTLIADSHETAKTKTELNKRAFQLFRALVKKGVVEFTGSPAQKLRVNADLQQDFSMNQALSLYLLEALPLLDPMHPDYALDVLTLVESVLEDPELILRKQLDRLKTQRMAEMKAEGMEYEARMEELEKLEYPKPLRDWIYGTFNAFADQHPWVGSENIRPKSIAREILEQFCTFSGYIKDYGLQRSEGLLLRHLNGVYKVLAQTVPDQFKTEAVRDMENWLGDLVRRIDSSLLEEWERLRNPNYQILQTEEILPKGALEAAADCTRDTRAFTAAIRARIFAFLVQLTRGNPTGALETLEEDLGEFSNSANQVNRILPGKLRELWEQYCQEHGGACRLDAEGRALRHTIVYTKLEQEVAEGTWRIQQVLQDWEDRGDWAAEFLVDLGASRHMGSPVLVFLGLNAIS